METNETFVKDLADRLARPETVTVEGEQRLLLPRGWTEQPRNLKPAAAPLRLSTLTGLRDYLKENRDGLVLTSLLCHVDSPTKIELRAKLEGEDMLFRRQTYAVADLAGLLPEAFRFGAFMDSETFIIALQVQFAPTPGRDALLELLAGIRDSAVRDTNDNGYSQEVTAKTGVAIVANAKVQNPVSLKPWRTFREVDQPESPFIVRLRSGAEGEKPAAALFEADGGAWKIEAIKRVAAWLAAELPKDVSVVA